MSHNEQDILKARALAASGRVRDAESLLRQHLRRAPGDPGLQAELGRTLALGGQRDQALFFARAAAGSKSLLAIDIAAGVFTMLGALDEEMEAVRRITVLDPSNAAAFNDLAVRLLRRRRLDGARSAIERAFSLAPHDHLIAANVALIYSESWSVEQALAVLRPFRDRMPDSVLLQHQMPYLSNYSDRLTAEEVFAEHTRMGALLSRNAPAIASPPLPPPADPDRTLRVGFLSGDFREHSVARFLEAILKHHDPGRMHCTLFPVVATEDETTRRFKGMADGWSTAALLGDREAAVAIRREGIDILFDLAGLTRGMRAGVFVARAAPVQVNYLGYPHTTGLSAMDYRIVDSVTDPPGSERLTAERLIRLDPCFLCYSPPPAAQEIAARGPAGSGPITFGSFNIIAKVTDTTLDLWAAILNRVPDSKLLLKSAGLSEPGIRKRAAAALGVRGIGEDRLELVSFCHDFGDHFRMYHRVDIALDTFPYNGTTTTCEALYMGVPVVTLAGDRHAARVGSSLLSAIGTPELIARTRDEYIALAVELAGSPERRARYHEGLREMLAGSPLGDAPAFVRRFEHTLRATWHERCSAP